MHKHIIKNSDDQNLVLCFVDGSKIELMPEQCVECFSEKESIVNKMYCVGGIFYWVVDVECPREIKPANWKKEGF